MLESITWPMGFNTSAHDHPLSPTRICLVQNLQLVFWDTAQQTDMLDEFLGK